MWSSRLFLLFCTYPRYLYLSVYLRFMSPRVNSGFSLFRPIFITLHPKLLTISSISVLALVVFCCWPFTVIFWESESFSCSWMWMVTWWFSCRRLVFVPPFPIMVLAVFSGDAPCFGRCFGLGAGDVCCALCCGLLGLLVVVVGVVVYRVVDYFGRYFPPLGVRWIPSPLMISWTSSSLSLFEISVVFLSLARM